MSKKSPVRVSRPARPTQDELDQRKLWAARNFGVQSEIAARANVSKTLVGHVLRGERWNPIVGRLLAEAGAPGFALEASHA